MLMKFYHQKQKESSPSFQLNCKRTPQCFIKLVNRSVSKTLTLVKSSLEAKRKERHKVVSSEMNSNSEDKQFFYFMNNDDHLIVRCCSLLCILFQLHHFDNPLEKFLTSTSDDCYIISFASFIVECLSAMLIAMNQKKNLFTTYQSLYGKDDHILDSNSLNLEDIVHDWSVLILESAFM